MPEKIYGRIQDGRVAEYPVTETQIKNRGKSVTDFAAVVYDSKPVIAVTECLMEKAVVEGAKIHISYTITALPLEGLFRTVIERYKTPDHPTVTVDEVDTLLASAIYRQINTLAQQKLDAFAATKNYNSIDQAASFKTSGIAEYASDGQIASDLRDKTWQAVESYIADVKAGKIAFPLAIIDFASALPGLSWDK